MRLDRNKYTPIIVQPDALFPSARVELHASDQISESDFLGVDPEFGDMPARVGWSIDSERTQWTKATMLHDATRRFHDTLAADATRWLSGDWGEAGPMNVATDTLADEIEAAEVLGIALHSPTDERRKLSPRELDRRHLATSAFLGIGPFSRSCAVATGPGVVDHASPTAQNEEDRKYSEDETVIIRGEESYGYRNR